MSDINKAVGKRIKFYRLMNHLSQKNLADGSGYKSFQAIDHIERGIRGIPIDKLILISKEMQLDIVDLMSDRGDYLRFKECF